MNKTNFIHGLYALFIQGAFYIVTQDAFMGAVAATALFFGREQAQQQYKIAKATGKSVASMSWKDGSDMTKWNQDAVLDLVVPTIATFAVAFGLKFLAGM